MRSKTALFLFAALACPALLGCSSSAKSEDPPLGNVSGALRQSQSCEDLTQSLRDDARSKMNRRIDAEIRAIQEGYPSYGYGYGYGYGGVSGPGLALAPAPQTAVDSADGSARGASEAAAPAHSETETQVKGVDEADIVKADGTRLYVLHGQKFLIVDAWPAPSLAVAGGIEIEGTPSEMFVANGKAVIFSTADGTALYTASGTTPRPPYSDGYAMPVYGGAVDIAPGGRGFSIGQPPQNLLTKVTVLALDGGTAKVTREVYFEGSYLSSRRVASQVRVILEGGTHGPALDYNPQLPTTISSTGQYLSPSNEVQIAAWEALRSKNEAAIAQTTYSDWVPTGFAKDAQGVRAASIACENFYIPSAGSTEFGMTQVQALDLDAPSQEPRSVAIVGAAETVYGNAKSLVLAGRSYTDPWVLRRSYAVPANASDLSTPEVASETLNYTHLHLFDVASDGIAPRYVASGTVPGEVKDQFSLDEKAGIVRVATTERRSGQPYTDGRENLVSHVYTLKNGASGLSLFGDAGPIAPGEQLYSTRYVGDKAYVVTWHVTDPLFVIDLADAAHPKVLGKLEIPGFSEYMHPLDDTHLLTIGRETDYTGHQHTDGGYWYGLSIQVFDVTNPLAPKLAHKYVYDGGDYATSEASSNHKAFTYFDERQLLAFPYVRQGGYGPTYSGPSSTLEVFHVDAKSGIQKLGSVDHSPLLSTLSNGNYGYCGGYFDGSVRRGVFFENVVYSISYGGILASDVASLSTPMSSVKFEAPAMQNLSCAAPGGAL